MIESARAGYSVVRLKSGDPLVFGRAGEEIAALRGAEISFEVVPGVTAALAAGATLGLPLTDRKSASQLIFCTAHHAADKADCTPIWSGPFPEDATLVVYMPGRDLGRIARELMAAGREDGHALLCCVACGDGVTESCRLQISGLCGVGVWAGAIIAIDRASHRVAGERGRWAGAGRCAGAVSAQNLTKTR